MHHLSKTLIVATVLALCATAHGKLGIHAIEVSGPGLAAPLLISDPDVVRVFSIWAGPNSGYRVANGAWVTDYRGAFVDFENGVVKAPSKEASVFEVKFLLARARGDDAGDVHYRARYAIDSSEQRGLIFLHGAGSIVSHGVERQWLNASPSWESRVRPIIENAVASGSTGVPQQPVGGAMPGTSETPPDEER